jgi:2-C-methyl-D-erythritol 2,4-cyclodiphosphate synthase
MAQQQDRGMNRNDGLGAQDLRIGHGYDLHRLDRLAPGGTGRALIVGGVRLEHDLGAVGHSDADVLLHAITDALLGSLALPDIGQLFPDTDAKHEGRDSSEFLREAVRLIRERGFVVVNLDTTVVLEKPKLGERKVEMRQKIAGLLGVDVERVNVKGKTGEGVGAVGEGRAIEAHAVVLLGRAVGP